MAVELVKGGEGWVVKLGGSVDIFEAAAVHQAAREAAERGEGPVVIALHEVESVDTSITQVLLALRGALARAGRGLRIEGASPAVTASWQRLGVGEWDG